YSAHNHLHSFPTRRSSDLNNSEIIAVEGFIIMGELSLDPGARGQNLSPLAMQALGRAMELEPENPRAMIMMAQMELGTAQFFGQDRKSTRLNSSHVKISYA